MSSSIQQTHHLVPATLQAYMQEQRPAKKPRATKSFELVDSAFQEAIEMSIDTRDEGREDLVTKIEVKNEELTVISQQEVQFLSSKFTGIRTLNLSMNKIANIEGSIDCPNLTSLSLSDNLIK